MIVSAVTDRSHTLGPRLPGQESVDSGALLAVSPIGQGCYERDDVFSGANALAWVHSDAPAGRHINFGLAAKRKVSDLLARLDDVFQVRPTDDAAGHKEGPGPPDGTGPLAQQDTASVRPSNAKPIRVVDVASWRGSPRFVATQPDGAAQGSTADLDVRRPDSDDNSGSRSTQEITVGNLGHIGDFAICRRQHDL